MSTYTISKSSLLSLKAEILRKHGEVDKAKLDNRVKIANAEKKQTPLDLKNKGVDERRRNDTVEDEDLLRKSRSVLEKKTILYDKLSKGSVYDDDNARFLVRFDKKRTGRDSQYSDDDSNIERIDSSEYDDAKNSDDEWVDYVDCLGRTRTCLRRDLSLIKEKDSDLKLIVEARRKESGEDIQCNEQSNKETVKQDTEIGESNELLSSDMRRELLRQKWEKEEEEIRNKTDVHYQDVLFDEARSHGVGYYSFSKDAEQRTQQQESLNKLRHETTQEQKKAQDLRALRDKQLAERVKAARNRRRARLGLPPEEDDESPPDKIPEKEEQVESQEKPEDLAKEEERKLQRMKHVRPWDIGKEGVVYTQEDWVDKKRSERIKEFAPTPELSSRKQTKNGKEKENRDFTVDTSKPPPKIRNPSKRPINPYKRRKSDEPERQTTFCNSPIRDLMDESDSDSSSRESILERNESVEKRVEIPPPPTYDYYGPSDAKKSSKSRVKPVTIEESISAGLKFLRQQAEKKQGSMNRENDMFLF